MVRRFAYREMRHHWGDAEGYRAAVAKHVAILNADFPIPLGGNELGHISQSISDWTINYSRMWNDGPPPTTQHSPPSKQRADAKAPDATADSSAAESVDRVDRKSLVCSMPGFKRQLRDDGPNSSAPH
ncbi:hypothetical protein [Pseudonocardia sp. ICBG1142]|uniref:hypothetical protein n=1 Tax=Pseudonocardia sp. ICBG1142 TaxID=2846760 RepID=UPI001CF60ADC|nr:hypothetical protein [Pseudonocardia sp. ICBG1142]